MKKHGKKSVLNRAKALLSSNKISDIDLIELSIILNEYIDVLDDFNSHKNDKEYMEKEFRMREILNTYCDNVEASFLERNETHGIRY